MSFLDHISARRAWHDCYYVRHFGSTDRLTTIMKKNSGQRAVAGIETRGKQQMMRIYVKSEAPGRKKVSHCIPLMAAGANEAGQLQDFFMAWDPLWRGRIQASIKGMSKKHRAFGMIMYAPLSEAKDDDVELIHGVLKSMFYSRLDAAEVSRWHSRKAIRIHFLLYAALQYYRDLVFGGGATLGGPVAIDNYMYSRFGERIPSARKNWYRDWQPLWDVMVDSMDAMERETLRPVAVALQEMRSREAEKVAS